MRGADLSDMFGVSEVTVRSDLDQLARASLVDRVHGGAMTRGRTSIAGPSFEETEPSFEESADTLADEKDAIGRAAASLVSSGDSLIIDVGTTTTAVAHALNQRTNLDDIVVFTNSLTIAMQLEPAIPRFTVILTGGKLRPRQHSLVNPMGSGILEQINVAMAFIGCNGIHPTDGVTNINLPEAQIKSKMIDQKEAESTLISNIIEEYTKDVRFNNVVGEALISEHKMFKPSMDDIRFKIDLVYVPIWEVKGARNSVEINAYTQEILTNPVDDDVEFM